MRGNMTIQSRECHPRTTSQPYTKSRTSVALRMSKPVVASECRRPGFAVRSFAVQYIDGIPRVSRKAGRIRDSFDPDAGRDTPIRRDAVGRSPVTKLRLTRVDQERYNPTRQRRFPSRRVRSSQRGRVVRRDHATSLPVRGSQSGAFSGRAVRPAPTTQHQCPEPGSGRVRDAAQVPAGGRSASPRRFFPRPATRWFSGK